MPNDPILDAINGGSAAAANGDDPISQAIRTGGKPKLTKAQAAQGIRDLYAASPESPASEEANNAMHLGLPLAPPKNLTLDTTQIPRNPFTNELEFEPPMPTEEEKAKSGTIGPQTTRTVTVPGPRGGFTVQVSPTAGEGMARAIGAGAPSGSAIDQFKRNAGLTEAELEQERQGGMRLFDPSLLMSETERQQHPILTGAGEFAGGMTSPESLALIGLTGGAGELTGPGEAAARRLLAAGFSIPMLISAARMTPAIGQAFQRGDTATGERLLTHAVLTAGLAGLAGHGMFEEPKPLPVPNMPDIPFEPVGAGGEQLHPELPETIRGQIDHLKGGTLSAVYIPEGQKAPEAPEGTTTTVVKGNRAGAGTWLHDSSITPDQIRAAVKDGTYGQLLGFTQTKEAAAAAGTPGVVAARDADGTELKAALADVSDPHAVAAQASELARQFPDAQIGIETPEQTIRSRQAPTARPETSVPETGSSARTTAPQEAGFPNASAESDASLEAIKRARRERRNGIQRVRIDTRSGQETTLIGPEALDAKPGPFDRIIKRYADGREELVAEGAQARPVTPAAQARPAREEEPEVGIHDLGEIGTEPTSQDEILNAIRGTAQTSPVLNFRKGQPLAERFSAQTLEEARQELLDAHQLASSFEQPGRYFALYGDQHEHMPSRSTSAAKGIHSSGVWYGVSSSRHIVAEQFPWYGEIEQGPVRLGKIIEKGKGAEYNRLLATVAEHIQSEKESAAPIMAEFAPELKKLSEDIDGNDQDLSDSLSRLANSDGRGFKNLREYVQEKIENAKQARDFFRAIDEAANEAREASTPETSEHGGGTRTAESSGSEGTANAPAQSTPQNARSSESSQSEENQFAKNSFNLTPTKSRANPTAETPDILPGLENAVEEQRANAARVRGERLTEEANQPLGNVNEAVGQMESKSPLFRGTEASPQRELLESPVENAISTSPRPGTHVQIISGKLKGQTAEVTRTTDEGGVYVRTSENSRVQYVKAGDFELHPAGHGPGTPLAGHLDTTGTRIDRLAQTIRENAVGTKPVLERMKFGEELAAKAAGAKDAVTRSIATVKGATAALADALLHPAKWTNFDDSLGKYQGAIQRSALDIRTLAKSLREAVPDPVRREGMTNFIEAGGDVATLQKWAAASKGAAKRGYETALNLNDAERTIARNLMSAQDERFELDRQAGLLEHEVENYVMHAWGRTSKFTKKIVNTVRTMMLETKPSFTKQRVFGTYFDGEQAGYKPVNKDVGFLFSAREHSANQAIAARAFIRSLFEGKADDGRPLASVSGSGRKITAEETKLFEDNPEAKAYLIDAKTRPEEVADYRSIDHPALRKWTWAATDENGKPIFVGGDIVVHPDIYRKLKNVLGNSALRALTIPGTDIQPFRIAAKLSSEFKNTLLSFSGFHQTQETLHALFHGINPANTKAIDLTDPVQQKLVDHGLQVASFDAQQAFGEGVASGLTNRLPVIGKYFQRYNDYLFSDYIPRLKMALGKEALERNLQRYKGKLSEDQIYAITANQANAAFGELNYTMMARNKTFQDVLRMTLLAPDFLEARGRFVGQALKPYGREQAFALVRGALGLYVTARILNTILDKDPHWDAQDAFNVVYHGRTFTLRSVPADIGHLFTDPRGFAYNRLNPIYGRGAIEAITGRDQYGRKRTITEEARDLGIGGIPIPFQGALKRVESSPLDTALSSAGVSTYPYRTPAERLAREYTMDSLPLGEESKDRTAANRLAYRLEDQLRKETITVADLRKYREDGQLSAPEIHRIAQRAARTPLQNSFRSLTAEQALNVWKKANASEREQIRPLLANKLGSLKNLPPEKRQAWRDKIIAALHGQRGAAPTAAGLPLEPSF